jgi:hypothetical protein
VEDTPLIVTEACSHIGLSSFESCCSIADFNDRHPDSQSRIGIRKDVVDAGTAAGNNTVRVWRCLTDLL